MIMAVRAILQLDKVVIRESTVAQDAHNVHVFTHSVLIAATRLMAETTKVDSVQRALVQACKAVAAHNKEVIAHVKATMVVDTTIVVAIKVALNREDTAHVTTATMAKKEDINHAKVDTRVVVVIKADHSKVAIVHVITTKKEDTSHKVIALVITITLTQKEKRTTMVIR